MILTAKEEAKELVGLFYMTMPNDTLIHEPLGEFQEIFAALNHAKQCALIAVDKILQIFNNEWTKLDFWTEEINGTINFWLEVKQEIEKL
jgi:hypothetical protein